MPERGRNNLFFSQITVKKVIFLLVLVIIFDFCFFPAPALASEVMAANETAIIENSEIVSVTERKIEPIEIINTLPVNDSLTALRSAYYTVTAYNSEVGQCDSTPCITANGFNVCEHGVEDSVAANFLKFGTKIRFPELYGDKVFVVRDRMNKRYNNRLDIWMQEKQDAKKFGVKILKVDILAEP